MPLYIFIMIIPLTSREIVYTLLRREAQQVSTKRPGSRGEPGRCKHLLTATLLTDSDVINEVL
jgi:hypothetical protein